VGKQPLVPVPLQQRAVAHAPDLKCVLCAAGLSKGGAPSMPTPIPQAWHVAPPPSPPCGCWGCCCCPCWCGHAPSCLCCARACIATAACYRHARVVVPGSWSNSEQLQASPHACAARTLHGLTARAAPAAPAPAPAAAPATAAEEPQLPPPLRGRRAGRRGCQVGTLTDQCRNSRAHIRHTKAA